MRRELTDEVLESLVRDGTAMFDRLTHDADGKYVNLILADPRGAREALRDLRSGSRSFLELGSGLGVITIIADLLGYDAYGIEIEPRLVDESCRLAESCGSTATFIEGSFVPPDFQEEIDLLSADFNTVTSGADAYEEMGMTIADFDVVYAYPWPDETEWLHSLFRRYAGPHAALLSYSVRDGFEVSRQDSSATDSSG
ncbi:MAG: class I SAM-dependent methyltransferase [Planctomycetes bacterium]|nr:class I SAM-dependent methyltransferase [Planctomycetota bacterium]